MTKELTTFAYLSNTIRVVQIDGNPWFVAADVCRAPDLAPHRNTGFSQHLRKLDPVHEVIPTSAVGIRLHGPGQHNARIISASGLYKLIMRSDKPEARAFQGWVTRDVLPAIRKDGAYIMGEEKLASGEMSEDEFIFKAAYRLGEKDGIDHRYDLNKCWFPRRTEPVRRIISIEN
jgi:prophage antirepressor-like protein